MGTDQSLHTNMVQRHENMKLGLDTQVGPPQPQTVSPAGPTMSQLSRYIQGHIPKEPSSQFISCVIKSLLCATYCLLSKTVCNSHPEAKKRNGSVVKTHALPAEMHKNTHWHRAVLSLQQQKKL